jgi:hypothetical protein
VLHNHFQIFFLGKKRAHEISILTYYAHDFSPYCVHAVPLLIVLCNQLSIKMEQGKYLHVIFYANLPNLYQICATFYILLLAFFIWFLLSTIHKAGNGKVFARYWLVQAPAMEILICCRKVWLLVFLYKDCIYGNKSFGI